MAAGDSINSLRRQLRNSEREMKRIEREMEKQREQMRRQQQEEQNRLRQEMQKALEQQGKEADLKYQKLLDEYNRHVQGQMSENLRQMEAAYDALWEQADQARKQWLEQTAELEAQVYRQKEDQAAKEEEVHQEAVEQLDNLSEQLKNMQEIPCEFFQRGRLDILTGMMNQAIDFLHRRIDQSAIGMVLAARADASRLKLEVEERMQQWQTAYLEWKKLWEETAQFLKTEADTAAVFLEAPVELKLQEQKSHDWNRDMDYWSQGEWEKEVEKARLHETQILAIEQEGIQNYLKSGHALSLDQLKENKAQLAQALERLKEVDAFYKNTYLAYQNRLEIGQAIIDRLEDEGLDFISDGFAETDREKLSLEWRRYLDSYGLMPQEKEEDFRSVYCLSFCSAEGDLLAISIIPVRKENQVLNQVQYCVELLGALSGETYEKGLLHLLISAVETAKEQTGSDTLLEEEDLLHLRDENQDMIQPENRNQKVIADTIRRVSRQAVQI